MTGTETPPKSRELVGIGPGRGGIFRSGVNSSEHACAGGAGLAQSASVVGPQSQAASGPSDRDRGNPERRVEVSGDQVARMGSATLACCCNCSTVIEVRPGGTERAPRAPAPRDGLFRPASGSAGSRTPLQFFERQSRLARLVHRQRTGANPAHAGVQQSLTSCRIVEHVAHERRLRCVLDEVA